jgi:hypothetical protein
LKFPETRAAVGANPGVAVRCFDPAWETARYFPLKPGEFLQGLLARINYNARVYVVTVPPPAEYADFQRRPRVVSARA